MVAWRKASKPGQGVQNIGKSFEKGAWIVLLQPWDQGPTVG